MSNTPDISPDNRDKDESRKDTISDKIKNALTPEPSTENTTLEEKVSKNSKDVLIFVMVTLLGIIALYTLSIAVLGTEATENLNAVYIAGVAGLLSFAGALVVNLWGK